MNGGKVMERVYVCKNGVREKTRYWVGPNAKARGKRKKGNTSFRKQEANHRTAVKQLARIFNCNLDHTGFLIGLDFDEESYQKIMQKAGGDIEKAKTLAQEQGKLWLRRVKRKFKVNFCWMGSSFIDGRTGEVVRLHIHVVIMGDVSRDEAEKAWKLGTADFAHLRRQPDYTPLAVYLMRQLKVKDGEKRYYISRGFLKPETEEREVLCNNEIKAPPGAIVFEHNYSAETVNQYMRYLPRTQEKRGGSKILRCAQDDGKTDKGTTPPALPTST